jgi:hypothetical protein
MKDDVERARQTTPDEESWDILFGKKRFERR